MDFEDLKDLLREAILKAASDPNQVQRRYRRRSSINGYFRLQYSKMAATAGASGIGGWFTGALLTAVAAGNLLRCVANMTYAYGYSVEAEVERHDFLGVLAIWMGKMPEDVLGGINGFIKTTRGPGLALRAAKPMIERVSDEIFVRVARLFLPYIVEHLAARLAVRLLSCVAPILSCGVLVAVVTNDYSNIKIAIRQYYEAKQRLGA